jgi:hypothetical protein
MASAAHAQAAGRDACADALDPFACHEHDEWRRIDAWPGRVARPEGRLSLRLDGGRGLTLQDGVQEAAEGTTAGRPLRVTYVFRDYLPRANAYVVELQTPDDRAFLLVEASSGRRTVLSAEPVFSPDGTRFVEAAPAGRLPSQAAQIVVWRMDEGGPVREFQWHATPADSWDPADPVWTSPAGIRLTRRSEDRAGLSLRETAVALRLTPAGWQMGAPR